jgi:hypothetical protein
VGASAQALGTLRDAGRPVEFDPMDRHEVSVIVPVYGRAGCLVALDAMTGGLAEARGDWVRTLETTTDESATSS